MKRTISILVIVAMMLASVLAIVPAYAAEPTGTPVTNEAEFLAMAADGTYYLANDITLTTNYAEEFKGTLDGNGKTVTLKGYVSMFDKLAMATVTNLNIVADFTADSGKMYGPLSRMANGIFDNIHTTVKMIFPKEGAGNYSFQWGGIIAEFNGSVAMSNCSASGEIRILSTSGGNDVAFAVGGLVGKAMGGYKFELKNCVNYVEVECNTYRTSNGGLIGCQQGNGQLSFENCVNYGSVTGMTGDHSGSAGFVGAANCNNNAASAISFKNCRNYGNIGDVENPSGAKKDHAIGGMLGRGYGPASVSFENCINSGTITSVGGGWSTAGGLAAGIMTYNFSWSNNKVATFTFKNCVNLGNVSGASYCGGIVGGMLQMNSKDCKATFENCANYGETTHGGILGFTGNGGAMGLTMTNCYNAGKVAAGMIYNYNAAWDSAAVDATMTDVKPAVTFTNCVNDAEGDAAILKSASDFDLITITGCATTVAEQVIAPENEKITIGEAPADVAAAKTALLALVPANSADLDVLVAANKDNDPADYTAGWDAFASALEQALAIANKASSAEDVKLAVESMDAAVKGLVLNTNIDFSALDAVLAEAAEIEGDEDLYTPATWAVFAAAVEAANATAEAEKQSVVNKATAALTAAIAALEFKPDFDALDAEMAKHADLKEADYTTASWAVFKAALDTALTARANENATGSYINQVIADLAAAAAALDAKVALDSLNTKVVDVKANYVKDQFTAKSYEPVTQALRAADEALKSGDVGAAGLATLIENLDKAIAGLLKRATFAELDPLVTECEALNEDDYTEESWVAFVEALENASEAMTPAKKNNVSEAQEAELLEALKAAKDALIGWADYTEIDPLVNELKALKAEDYTEDSWAALQTALAAVNTLKSNRNATKPESDEVLANLQAAKAALVEAAAPTVEATQPEATEPTTSGGCGGTIAIGATVVVAILGTAIALKKKED